MTTTLPAIKGAGVEGQYCFLVEWFDSAAAMSRQYNLLYYLLDDTLELYDIKNRRTFLKRCSYPSVKLSDLYIGAQVTVYSRPLRVIDFGDSYTTSALAVAKGKSLALLKPRSYSQWGRILTALEKNGFKVGRMKTIVLSPGQAQQFYGERVETQRTRELSEGPMLALEIIGSGAHRALLDAAERPHLGEAVDAASRGQLGSNPHQFAELLQDVHLASSERNAETELSFFFDNPSLGTTATQRECTLALIKPHAVQQGYTGGIITEIIEAGFDISALELFNLDKTTAEEIMEVYRTVVPEYHSNVEQLVSGPVIAMEIRAPRQLLESLAQQQQSSSSAASSAESKQSPPSVVQAFRAFAGPADPEIARHLRPHSLRARFGQTKVKNAVHCTDLDEDGVLESAFFFDVLQSNRR